MTWLTNGKPVSSRDTLRLLKRDIEDAIAANKAAQVDRIDRFRLDRLTDQLQRYYGRVTGALADPSRAEVTALYLGPNARGPAIADLIRQSLRIREPFEAPVEEGFRIAEKRELAA